MEYSERFREAFLYAAELHSSQTRKGGSKQPYITHLMGVAALVADYGGDEEQVIAGLLHDAAEDHGGRATLAEIRRRFGERVARLVEALTDGFDGEPKAPWRPRKEAYIARLAQASEEELLVSAADKLNNVRAFAIDYRFQGPKFAERFEGGLEGRLWYYRALADTFARIWSHPLAEDLQAEVEALERTLGVK